MTTFEELQNAKDAYYRARTKSEQAWHNHTGFIPESGVILDGVIDRFPEDTERIALSLANCEELSRQTATAYDKLQDAYEKHRMAHAELMEGL